MAAGHRFRVAPAKIMVSCIPPWSVQRNRLTHLQGDVHTTVAGAECGFPAPDSNPGNNRNSFCALVDFKPADFMDDLGFVMHDCARVAFA